MRKTFGRFGRVAGILIGILMSGALPAAATDGTWTNVLGGLWNTSGNWSGGNIANGVGSTADISANIGAARTIINDTTVTLGTLNIGDSNTSHAYTLTNSTGSLTFNSASGSAGTFLNFHSTSGGDTIASPFTIADSGGLTISNASANGQTISGVISGSKLTINNSGVGMVTLSASNTFTGPVTISAGVVYAPVIANGGVASSLGNASGSSGLVFDGGTLQCGLVSLTTDRGFTINDGKTAVIQLSTENRSLTFSGDIPSSTGGLLVRGTSTRTLILSGTKGFRGGITVDAGKLTMDGNNQFANDVVVTNGATLRLNGTGLNNNYVGITVIHPGSRINVMGDSTWNNDVVNNGVLGVVDGTSSTFGGLISGTGDFTLSSVIARMQTITGTNNTFTGKTSISSGLTISKIANLGLPSSLGAPTSVANGTIDLNSTASSSAKLKYVGAGDTSDRVINFLNTANNNEIESSGSGALVLTSSLTTSGGAKTLILSGTDTNDNTIQGSIPDGSGPTALTKNGAGTWVLSGNNTYTGTNTITAGTLRLVGDSALGTGNVVLAPGNASTAIIESSTDIVRASGTGAGQMRIAASHLTPSGAGFSAKGGDITVAFGSLVSPESLTWGTAINTPPFGLTGGALVLNSVFADSKLTFLNPINLNNAAAGVTRTIQVNANVAEMSGALTQSGGVPANLIKTGAGTLILSGNSTLSNVTVSAGTLNMTGNNIFSNLTVSAGSATLSGTNTFNNATLSAGALTLNGSNTYNNVTVSGGTLTLGGSRAPRGTMTFSVGNLVLDYTMENNDKLNPANALTLGSAGYTAGLTILGHPSTPFTQAINGLTLAGAAHTITMSGTTALSLGSISRAVGIGALAIANAGSGTIGTTSGTANLILTNANGIAYATYSGDWAAKDAGNTTIVAGESLGGFYTADTWAAGNNTDVTGSSAPSSGSTTHSLRFNTPGASTITLAGANKITTGGILVTPNVGANLTKITGSGTLSQPTGSNNGEIMVIQNNTNGDFQIDSVIANTSGQMNLTKVGPGKLILTANNTATGYLNLNAGTVQFGDGVMTGALTTFITRGLVAQNGTVARVAGGVGGLTVPIGALGGAGNITIDVVSNSTMTTTGMSGPNWVKTGAGTLQLTGTGFNAGWVKEGTFIANVGNVYFINGGATIGDTAPGALPATVFLLNATRPDSLGNATTYINRSGTLDYNNQSMQLGASPTFVGGGTVTSTHVSPGTATLQGTVTYNATNSSDVGASISVVPLALGVVNRTFTINDSAYVDTEMTISSAMSGTNALIKAGAGTLALTGNNSYTGMTTVSAGTLIVKKPASLPNHTLNNRIVVSAAATLAVSAGGAGEWTAADLDALRGTTPSPFAAASFLGIDTTGGSFTYGSAIGDGVGALGLRKLGTNALTLTQANTYTGGTRVEKGTLVAGNANALGTSGTITVYSNAMLGVASGVTFSRAVTFAAGSGLTGNGTFLSYGGWTCPANFTLAPGLPTGTLTVDVGGAGKTLTLSANNALRIAFQPDTTSGTLMVNGALDISDPTARLVLTGKPPLGTTVLAEGASLNGTFLEANIDMTGLSPKGTVRYTGTQVILASFTPGSILKVY